MRRRGRAWGLVTMIVAVTGCTEKVPFTPLQTTPRDPGLRSRDLQIEAQLGLACGAIARAHEVAEVRPGQLDAFLNGPAPADESSRQRKRRGKRVTEARNELGAAEQMWSYAIDMGACVEDLCCVHDGDGERVTLCSQQAEDPSRAFVERFWIPLPNGLCLQATGDAVTQQQCEDLPSQRWFVTEVEGGKVTLRNAADRRCLTVSDPEAGTVIMAECDPQPEQRFSPKRAGDGQQELRHEYPRCEPGKAKDGKPPCPVGDPGAKDCVPAECNDELGCLEAEWGDEPGAGVRLAECQGGANQGFTFARTRLLQTRRIGPEDSGCAPGATLRPLDLCPRVAPDDQTEYRFLPLSSAARGELRWVCDGGEGAAQCPEKTRYVELRREASVTVMRCYE